MRPIILIIVLYVCFGWHWKSNDKSTLAGLKLSWVNAGWPPGWRTWFQWRPAAGYKKDLLASGLETRAGLRSVSWAPAGRPSSSVRWRKRGRPVPGGTRRGVIWKNSLEILLVLNCYKQKNLIYSLYLIGKWRCIKTISQKPVSKDKLTCTIGTRKPRRGFTSFFFWNMSSSEYTLASVTCKQQQQQQQQQQQVNEAGCTNTH